MHSIQNSIVRLIPNHHPPLETRIWKLVVRASADVNIKKYFCFHFHDILCHSFVELRWFIISLNDEIIYVFIFKRLDMKRFKIFKNS